MATFPLGLPARHFLLPHVRKAPSPHAAPLPPRRPASLPDEMLLLRGGHRSNARSREKTRTSISFISTEAFLSGQDKHALAQRRFLFSESTANSEKILLNHREGESFSRVFLCVFLLNKMSIFALCLGILKNINEIYCKSSLRYVKN